VTSSSKRKGDKAEAEIARYLSDLTGWDVRRAYGAGRPDDRGDLSGLPYCVAQVRNWPSDVLGAERTALRDAKEQAARVAKAYFPVALVRHPGGEWVAAMSPTTFARLLSIAAAWLDR
jgi:hypothetical protein